MARGSGAPKEVSKLLFCACRDRCQNKTVPQSTTHKCPGCNVAIHSQCGFPDVEDRDIRWCHHCKLGSTPSPFQRLTRRQALEMKSLLPKDIFGEKHQVPLVGDITDDKEVSKSKRKTNTSVAQLPNCACRDRCGFPDLPRATGHHCPGCKLAIHAVCGIHDETAGLDNSNWCYDCWESRMPIKMPAGKISTSTTGNQQNRETSSTHNSNLPIPGMPNDLPPKCACRDRCGFPDLPRATGHHCPGCKLAIHAVCGIHDETAGLDNSNWCYDCWESSMQLKMPARKTLNVQKQQSTVAMARSTKGMLVKQPQKKSRQVESTREQQKATSMQQEKGATKTQNSTQRNESTQRKSSSMRTKNLKNKIVLPKDATAVDPFVRTKVAFYLDGPERPDWLMNRDYLPYGKNVGSRLYLLGMVLRRDKVTKTACTYRVEWEHTALGESVIDINVLQPAIDLARKLQHVLEEESKHPLGVDVLHFLQANDGSAPGAAIQSDDDEGNSKESDAHEEDQVNFNEWQDKDDDISVNFDFPSLQRTGQTPTQQDGLLWATDTYCSPSLDVYDQMKRSTIKADMQSRFTNPLSSFLAFLPLEFWKLFVFQTNRYAANKQAQATLVDGGPSVNWASRLTLNEMFTFVGILIQMTMRPTPGQTYTNCWQDKRWHPYTDRMPLRRFQAIRGMLHMTEKGFPEESSNDALYKVRPLLNVLKKTLGDYLIPGSDLALDETSVACRSKYGRNLIFYNNTKPSGKYHFRFYALCDSDSYSCLRIVIHTRNGSDRADGYVGKGTHQALNIVDNDSSDDENINELGKTTKLVLDIARPFYHSGRVLNMDRYYTSPEVFLELRKQGLYARGTCMTNRRMFPKMVTFTEAEARKERRGSCRLAVNQENNLVAIGWIDGNPVHLITTADGTEMTQVKRRVQQEQRQQSAPTAVRKYGRGMQAVDRFDQLMSLYSLAKRHAFKKWYLKLTMALLDVGMINAEIHYFMVNPDEKRGMYRYNYREKLCAQLFDTDWSLYEGMSNNDALEAMRGEQEDVEEVRNFGPMNKGNSIVSCTPLMVNQYITSNYHQDDTDEAPVKTYKGVCCQVCMFEGRKTRTKSVAFCANHGIRACLTTPNLSSFTNKKFQNAVEKSTKEELAMWRCPMDTDSCWSKAHAFYIGRGLWRQGSLPNANDVTTFRHHGVKITSTLYKNKEDWMLKHGLISKKGGTRGRKSQKRQTVAEQSTTQETKRRRQNITTTPTTATRLCQGNSDHMGSDNEGSDKSIDSCMMQQVTQHATV
jgi:hypothetical protein